MEHFLCIMIFFQYAHDSFQVQLHLVYFFYAVVSFLHSCYVNVFHWFSVSSMCNTICLFEHKNQFILEKYSLHTILWLKPWQIYIWAVYNNSPFFYNQINYNWTHNAAAFWHLPASTNYMKL